MCIIRSLEPYTLKCQKLLLLWKNIQDKVFFPLPFALFKFCNKYYIHTKIEILKFNTLSHIHTKIQIHWSHLAYSRHSVKDNSEPRTLGPKLSVQLHFTHSWPWASFSLTTLFPKHVLKLLISVLLLGFFSQPGSPSNVPCLLSIAASRPPAPPPAPPPHTFTLTESISLLRL